MAEKKSFVAYYSWWDVISKLDDHQKALILEAMFSLGGVCEKPELDLVAEIAFIPIEREIAANIEKWEKTREARREAGRKGGKASGKNTKDEEQANQAIASFAKQEQAKISIDKQNQANQAVDVDVDADVDVVNTYIVQKDGETMQNKPSKREIDNHFEELWKLYPQKRGKNQVSDATKRKLYGVGISEMKTAIERYTHEVQTLGKQWLNGSTWFNGRFLDYIGENYQPPKVIVKPHKVDGRYRSNEGFRDFSRIEE